jgi:hypothetical protein
MDGLTLKATLRAAGSSAKTREELPIPIANAITEQWITLMYTLCLVIWPSCE